MTSTSDNFSVSAGLNGEFLLAGALDMNTLPEVRDLVDEFRVPDRAVVLDLAAITFLDTMTIHWLVELSDATGEPVLLRNVPDTARLVLGIAGLLGSDGGAWVIDDSERHAPA